MTLLRVPTPGNENQALTELPSAVFYPFFYRLLTAQRPADVAGVHRDQVTWFKVHRF